jgi:HAMP domain-containing protein
MSRAFGNQDGAFQRTRELTNPDLNYKDLGSAWDAGVGSRQVPGEMLDEIGKLKPADIRRMDSPNLRRAAGDVLSHYESRGRGGAELRPDLMNMLSILRDNGIEGLRKAYGDPRQLLPALAAVGLAPVLLEGARSSEED